MRTHILKRYDLDFVVSLTGSKYLALSNLTNNARVLEANAAIKGKKNTREFSTPQLNPKPFIYKYIQENGRAKETTIY